MKTDQIYEVKKFTVPTRRYCQTMSLKDNPELIAAYKKVHSEEESWEEIRAGIRAVGILEMEIYLHDNQVFMIVEAPIDFEWEKAMAQLAIMPRQAEWEEKVAQFQECDPADTSAEKWKMSERIFYLYD